MMQYQTYQVFQAERPKTAAEIRRADDQLGYMAQNLSRMWQHATRPIVLLRGQDRQPACSTLLDATR